MKQHIKKKRKLTPEEEKIILDKTISIDMAAIFLDISKADVDHYRQLYLYKEARKRNSNKYKKEEREKNLKKFGKRNACYNFWTAEQINYILTSTETDDKIAEKLNKTVGAIRQKRYDLKKKGHSNE